MWLLPPLLWQNTGTPMTITFTPTLFVPSIQYGLFGGRRLQNFPPNADEGFLLLHAPAGFAFSMENVDEGINDGLTTCSRSVLEVVDRGEGDLSGLFLEGTDMKCTVENVNTTRIRFHGEKALLPGVSYRYSFYVDNPLSGQLAEPWEFYSYKKKIDHRVREYGLTIPLDKFTFPGFVISPTVRELVVDNLSKEYNGDFDVRKIRVSLRFGDHVMDGDVLSLYAPLGINLVTRTLLGHDACVSFAYVGTLLPLLNTPDPTCSCEGVDNTRECKLVFIMQESAASGIALVKGALLGFEIGGVNPTRTPDEVSNVR